MKIKLFLFIYDLFIHLLWLSWLYREKQLLLFNWVVKGNTVTGNPIIHITDINEEF